MEDIALLESLLTRMNQNQLALGAAVEELTTGICRCGKQR